MQIYPTIPPKYTNNTSSIEDGILTLRMRIATSFSYSTYTKIIRLDKISLCLAAAYVSIFNTPCQTLF